MENMDKGLTIKANKSKKRVTWSENSLRLCCVDQSGMSIQILLEPRAVTRHVFYKITTLYVIALEEH